MRILIAEDDVTSRALLTGMLRQNGHEVVETVDGAAAWDMMRQPDAPAIAILDWVMPEMDGPEVVRRIRALQTDRPPYVIMLSGRGEKADIIAGLEAGANDYLAKPFDTGELKARITVGCRMVELQAALAESKAMLAHQASHDPLTGLMNRRAILDCLHRELGRAGRHGDTLAVGMCDIDHFKKINDLHGHQTGDDVLCELSRVLNEKLREYDSVGRLGGEEFLLVVPMKAGIDPLPVFCRLCGGISQKRMKTRSGALSVTVSIGVAVKAKDMTVDALVGAADSALYRAKHQGRNRVVLAAGGGDSAVSHSGHG